MGGGLTDQRKPPYLVPQISTKNKKGCQLKKNCLYRKSTYNDGCEKYMVFFRNTQVAHKKAKSVRKLGFSVQQEIIQKRIRILQKPSKPYALGVFLYLHFLEFCQILNRSTLKIACFCFYNAVDRYIIINRTSIFPMYKGGQMR